MLIYHQTTSNIGYIK